MRRRSWLRWVVLALLLLLAATEGVSLLLRTGRVHAYLTARLSASFGRPVEVSNFRFSLLGGPRLTANFVTVGEDPRFGHEYFLRAERLTASLRWRSLLRGRFEFGTLSFARPSLNLVRAPDGHWNLESWLPPPVRSAEPEAVAPAPGASPGVANSGRLYRIEVNAGRINFKRGVNKHPFALVDVNGNVEQEGPGRWRIDLEARLMRAAVVVQQAGIVRVRGYVSGTSVRLQPAELQLVWEDASLSDALRLARGHDYGIRGRLAVELAARSQGARWSFAGRAQVRNLHRWDLPERTGDPALNLNLEADWWPQQARVELKKGVIEAPRSNLRVTGFVAWATPADTHFRFISSGLGLDDLLAWYRAFHPNVAEDIAVEGNAGIDLELSGWPPRVWRGVLATDGVRLRVPKLGEAASAGHAVLRLEPKSVQLLPVAVSLAQKAGTLRLDATTIPAGNSGANWNFELNLVGQTERSQDMLQVAEALGWAREPGWSIEGPAGLHLRWEGKLYPLEARPVGSIELRGLRLRVGFLKDVVTLANARIELGTDGQSVTLASAQAFGARWSGSLRSSNFQPWEFSLTADRLDVAELDRWLNPRWQQGLFERFVSGPARRVEEVVPGLRDSAELETRSGLGAVQGRGRLDVDQLLLAGLALRRVRAQVQLDGRRVHLSEAQAELYGGSVRGWMRAEFSPEPVYQVQAQLEDVNGGALAPATASLARRFAGTVSGQMTLVARGVGREALLRSLEGRGTLQVRDAQFHGVDLVESFRAGARRPGLSEFREASCDFALARGELRLEKFRLVPSSSSSAGELAGSAMELEAEGTVDLSRYRSPGSDLTLDLRVRVLAPALAGKISARVSSLLGQTFKLTGPLVAPEITRLKP